LLNAIGTIANTGMLTVDVNGISVP
jgi:hypothetical protein